MSIASYVGINHIAEDIFQVIEILCNQKEVFMNFITFHLLQLVGFDEYNY